MHTQALQGGTKHSPVDTVICFAEVNEGGVEGLFQFLVFVKEVLDDEGIVSGAAAGSESRLALGSVVVELCPPVKASKEG